MDNTLTYDIATEVGEMSSPGYNYEFKFGEYISKAFDISKDQLGQWVLYNLVYILCTMGLAITIIGLIAMPALAFGYVYTTRKVMKGGQVEIGDLFKGFDHFSKLFQVGLVFLGALILLFSPIIVGLIGLGLSGSFDSDTLSGPATAGVILMYLYYFFIILVMIVGQSLFSMTSHFAVYGNMSAIDAFKASFRFTKKQFWYWLLYIFAIGFLGGLGVYACYIGMLFTIQFAPVAKTVAFFETLGTDKYNERVEQLFPDRSS